MFYPFLSAMDTSSLVPTTVGSLDLDQLERTLGVFFIGYVVQMIGYGFTFFQTYVYYSRYPNDHWLIRASAVLVFAIDTALSGLVSQALYYYLVILFPYTAGLTEAIPTFRAEHGLSALAILICQIVYAYRVWTLTKNMIISGLIALLAAAGFAFGIIMTVQMIHNPAFAHLATSPAKAMAALSAALVFLPALMTFCAMCFWLNPSRNVSVPPLRGWFNMFIAYTFTRGGGATLIQFLYFITFIAMPSKQFWIPFQLVASKLFVNSLVTMLNSREIIHGQGVNEEDTKSHQTRSGSNFNPSVGPNGVRFNVLETKTPININVTRTVEHDASGKMGFDYEDAQSLNDLDHEANPVKSSIA